jgi:hypothetical protein
VEVPPRLLKVSEGDPILKRVLGTVDRVEEFGGEAGGEGTAEEVC